MGALSRCRKMSVRGPKIFMTSFNDEFSKYSFLKWENSFFTIFSHFLHKRPCPIIYFIKLFKVMISYFLSIQNCLFDPDIWDNPFGLFHWMALPGHLLLKMSTGRPCPLIYFIKLSIVMISCFLSKQNCCYDPYMGNYPFDMPPWSPLYAQTHFIHYSRENHLNA